jgi:hypothetical protein
MVNLVVPILVRKGTNEQQPSAKAILVILNCENLDPGERARRGAHRLNWWEWRGRH